jgi:UDP-sugar transporter A1/2/3
MEKSMLFLLLLVAQNTSKTLILRAAVGGKGHFLYSAAVLATEALKASASSLWVLNSGGSPASIAHFLRSEWRVFVRVMVPAGIYNAQQMLEFVALARLEAPVFSVIVQIKLLTTALFSWLVLGRRLRPIQLIALVLLMVGVILAQMRDGQSNHLALEKETAIGVMATLMIATLSGFAAVYTERVLKQSTLQAHSKEQDVLPYMQIQMALASLLIIGVFAVFNDFHSIVEYGLWHGFDRRAVVAVVSSAMGGLIVSAVLKYADRCATLPHTTPFHTAATHSPHSLTGYRPAPCGTQRAEGVRDLGLGHPDRHTLVVAVRHDARPTLRARSCQRHVLRAPARNAYAWQPSRLHLSSRGAVSLTLLSPPNLPVC